MSSNSRTNSMVIVAIPDENDRVWKMSSEKVPHLTLLFLGDADNVDNPESIVQFVEHAADRSLNRFYLPVDRRDELGEAKADVLFFKKNRYDFKAVRDFRGLLLKDDNIKTAYDSTSQHEFPDHVGAAGQPWIPHLTMGYPDSPAKPLPDDWESRIYSVDFNKIAVWMGNYEGPEFELKDYWDEMDNVDTPMDSPALAMALADRGEEFLSHYGKKGMKWGVRNVDPRTGRTTEKKVGMFDPQGHDLASDVVKSVLWPLVPPLGIFGIPAQVRLVRGGARGVKAKAIDVNEQRFAKKAHSDKNFVEIHNRSAEKFNREIGAINKKHPGDLSKDPKKQKAYDDDVQKLLQASYREAAKSIGNKPNTMHLDLEFKNDGMDFKIKAKQGAPTPQSQPIRVRHADGDDDETIEYTGKILRDPTGHILGLKFDDFESKTPEGEMAQTMDLGAAWLAHHGVKGMKWGVTRSNAQLSKAKKLRTEANALQSASESARGGTRKRSLADNAAKKHKHADALEAAAKKAGATESKPREGFRERFERKGVEAEIARRDKRPAKEVTVRDTIGSSKRKQTKITTKGGEDHPATEDAIRVAAATQKLKKSGTHALTNKELQEVAQRLNLETQVSVLMGKRIKKGPAKKFIEEQFKNAQNDPIKTFGKANRAAGVARTVLKTRKLAGMP